jgi:hypothetical protein
MPVALAGMRQHRTPLQEMPETLLAQIESDPGLPRNNYVENPNESRTWTVTGEGVLTEVTDPRNNGICGARPQVYLETRGWSGARPIYFNDGRPLQGCVIDVQVAQADNQGTPEVILELATGGANCCTLFVFLQYQGDGRWQPYITPMLKSGYLDDLDDDGKVELVTGDMQFQYFWTESGSHYLPLQILAFDPFYWFLDETPSYPQVLDTSIYQRISDLTPGRTNDVLYRPALTAIVAEYIRLGKPADGWAVFAGLLPVSQSDSEERIESAKTLVDFFASTIEYQYDREKVGAELIRKAAERAQSDDETRAAALLEVAYAIYPDWFDVERTRQNQELVNSFLDIISILPTIRVSRSVGIVFRALTSVLRNEAGSRPNPNPPRRDTNDIDFPELPDATNNLPPDLTDEERREIEDLLPEY